ncbi:Eco57I restriction-modification methylase domain-containing protein [Flavihumibacter stibioxidans]|uniref:DNA methylase n=1 Tax=Flavihumibacter stibioxidans TaxID=1834163 RepID=A0ABR7M3M6_9BACT|nr:helicase-related protein [Flavihumibacter stibioxidans]MBC6489615.1 DNA methylase [Flavihumibacter stibioxidans]
MSYNSQQKLKDNIEAIRIALNWSAEKQLTADQISALKNYAGFGGLKAVLFPNSSKEEWKKLNASKEDLKLHPQIMELHKLLEQRLTEKEYKQAIDSIRNSILTAFYTPEIIPQSLFTVLKEKGIEPTAMYEPSSGAGVFVTEAAAAFPSLQTVNAVEKDFLTGKVLTALSSSFSVSTTVQIKGFEETPATENGQFDLVVSNIPFGNFKVYDESIQVKELKDRIHNYFFAKGLDKLKDGGLLAYITTDAFLNSPSNHTAREYLFNHADFISLNVMPENLMKETGNTEAPSHLLIVQKNQTKQSLSAEEKRLLNTVEQQNEFGNYSLNQYIVLHPEIILGNQIKPGQDQYGKAHETIWQTGDINLIAPALSRTISEGFDKRFNAENLKQVSKQIEKPKGKQLTYTDMPENKPDNSSVQLGLFDTGSSNTINRAAAYINPADATVVDKKTVRILNIIRTKDKPEHELIVLMTAKSTAFKQYVYKLYSNAEELQFSANWMNAALLQHELAGITNRLNKYDQQFYNDGEAVFHISLGDDDKLEALKDSNPLHKEGTLIVHNSRVGFVSYLASDDGKPVFMPSLNDKKDLGFYEQYTMVRDIYFELFEKETTEQTEHNDLRKELNEAYESLTKGYGLLNSSINRQRILKDEAFGLTMLSSLERKEGEQFVKADILTQSLVPKQEVFTTDNPLEALAKSLNDKGKVDIEFIAAATDSTEAETIEALGNNIYLNPSTFQWETADQLLSGNVVFKLKAATEVVEKNPDNVQLLKSLHGLQKIQPEKIPFELLDFNLGERWIPLDYYNRFASQLFELNTEVNYFPSLDTFKVKARLTNAKINQEYAVTPKSGKTTYGDSLLEYALENTTPLYTYEIGTGDKAIRVPDSEAIQLAHQKIESIRNGFIGWLKELPDADKKELEKLYNDTFNCYVLREYDGSHLQFPGLDRKRLAIEDLYSSQKNSVWRIVQNRGALIDHEVGLGKTLTMVVASHEMKRLKIVNKPMILALKANVRQIADTYRKAYPNARILAPDENDFTPSKRMRLFNEIKNNNWDCIILTHDQFGKFPQSPEIQKQIIEAELDNVERDLHTIKDMGGEISRRMLKGLEIRKTNLGVKLQEIRKNIEEKKDAGINFRELGIDHLFVDEAHKYKNLTYTTRHDRVAGLGNKEGSQKALNMLFAVRELQTRFNSDLCVTFLSGTPISNSLTEMYLLFKYLRPKEMERQHVENFDGWAAVFAKKTTDFEFSITNEIIAKERFRHFIKVPELALFYNEITDYKTAKHINLDKPEIDEQLVNIPPTPEQQEFTKLLMQFAKTGDGELIGRPRLTDAEDKGRMLIATNYAKKMAADMRLIDSSKYSDHPNNKVNVCARKVAEIYEQSKEHKGTQILFCDIGTPKPNEFNIYDTLKQKLINDFKVASQHITFIHDWTDKQKPELFRKMNNGDIRILLGSTEKAGTGLNVQAKVVAMHHLDIPWKPSELEQRDGRGARQGNIVAKEFYKNKVKNFIYAVEQSLDNYKFNLLKNKQTFISQMKNCELNVRTIDEGSIDEKSGMNFSEYIAILSGDTTLLEKSKMEKKIAVLESLRNAHHKEIFRSRFKLENLQEEKGKTLQTLEKLSIDEKQYKRQLQYDKEGIKINPVHLQDLNSTDAEAIGSHLIHLYINWKPGIGDDDNKRIGDLYGFDLYIRRQKETYEDKGMFEYKYNNVFYAESKESGIKYSWNQGHINIDNPKLAARYFLNAIDRVQFLKEKYQKDLHELKQNIPMLEKIVAKAFDKEDELGQLKKDVIRLEREITIKIQANQIRQHDTTDATPETPVVKMEPDTPKNGKSLLPKKKTEDTKVKGMRI